MQESLLNSTCPFRNEDESIAREYEMRKELVDQKDNICPLCNSGRLLQDRDHIICDCGLVIENMEVDQFVSILSDIHQKHLCQLSHFSFGFESSVGLYTMCNECDEIICI